MRRISSSTNIFHVMVVVFCSAVLFGCGSGGGSGSGSAVKKSVPGLSTLSGKITASDGNYVDSDTNNPAAFYAQTTPQMMLRLYPT